MILRAAPSAICVASAVSAVWLWAGMSAAQDGGTATAPTAPAAASAPVLPALPPPPPPVTVTVVPAQPAAEPGPGPADAISESDELPPKPEPPPGPPPRWSLGINPLAFLFGRVGGDVEYAATGTVAVVGNLHFDASAALTNTGTDHYVGFGGELGLRLYPKGSLYGFFMGPSVIAGYYSVDYYGSSYPLPNGGLAFDFGAKGRVGKNGFLMVGVGAQHLWSHPYPTDFPWPVAQAIGGGGWPLRLLFSFGWTFR